jgi:hypothetical protein
VGRGPCRGRRRAVCRGAGAWLVVSTQALTIASHRRCESPRRSCYRRAAGIGSITCNRREPTRPARRRVRSRPHISASLAGELVPGARDVLAELSAGG